LLLLVVYACGDDQPSPDDTGHDAAAMDAHVASDASAMDGSRPDMDGSGPRDAGASDGGGDAADGSEDASADDAAGPRPIPVGVDEFCDAWYAKNCEWIERCFGAGSCEGDLGPMNWIRETCPSSIAAVHAGRLALDGSRARTCLDQHIRCGDLPPHNHPACQGLWSGTVEAAGLCYVGSSFDASECEDGTSCTGCPGTCVVLSEFDPLGAFCGRETCAAGLSCQLIPEEQVFRCVTVANEGEECGGLRHCRLGTFCSRGRCASQLERDEQCRYDFQCGAGAVCRYDGRISRYVCTTEVALGGDCSANVRACVEGSYCHDHGDRLVCTAYGEEGDACANRPCNFGLVCDGALDDEDAGIDELACRPLSTLNERCRGDGDCVHPLLCTSDARCAPPGGAGAPCEDARGCDDTTYCASDGRCAPEGRPGDPCSDEATCDDFLGSCRSDTLTCEAKCLPPTEADGVGGWAQ
jgi:hypothetical protein